MSYPMRIQRRRTKGWRLPAGVVCVTRPGRYGNPFRVDGYYKIGKPDVMLGWIWVSTYKPTEGFTKIETVEQAVEWYRRLLTIHAKHYSKMLAELRGKDLACWCGLDAVCHADILLEKSNAPA